MLSQIVLKNNEILKEHFEKLLGENHTVVSEWAFPVAKIIVTQETELLKAIFEITFDMMSDNYALRTHSIAKEVQELPEGAPEGAIPLVTEKPDWLTIDSNTINFFIARIKEISEQFFTTREIPQPVEEEAPKNVKGVPVEEVPKEVPVKKVPVKKAKE